jgi:DedD protein
MPPPVADDDHKRRARRRLIGAVALTIVAVIILPLVLEDESPPAGPLEVHMPPRPSEPAAQNTIEFAPPAPDEVVAPARAEPPAKPAEAPKPVVVPVAKETPKPVATPLAKEAPKAAPAAAYAVQVGVFSDKANAERAQARIAALGLKPYTDQVGDSTRVRVGSFANRADADALSAKLTAAGMTAKVVEK